VAQAKEIKQDKSKIFLTDMNDNEPVPSYAVINNTPKSQLIGQCTKIYKEKMKTTSAQTPMMVK
jgi:hypothetical protein